MKELYNRLIVTKLSQSQYDRFKERAKQERRTLSGLGRVIIEDYLNESDSIDMKN